jgi:chromosome segregation ATPase
MGKTKYRTETTSASSAVSDAMSEIQGLRDEMTEWRDNIEEKFSQTDKFKRVSEAADMLDQVADNEPTEPGDGFDETVSFMAEANPRGLSRRARLANAVAALEAVVNAAEGKLADMEEEHDIAEREQEQADEAVETAKGEIEDAEAALAAAQEAGDDVGAATAEDALAKAKQALVDAEQRLSDANDKLDEVSEEKVEELRTYMEEIQEVIDNVQDVEFPGMFG